MNFNEDLLRARTEDGSFWSLRMMASCDSFMLWRALPGQPQEQFIKITDPAVAVLVFCCFTESNDE